MKYECKVLLALNGSLDIQTAYTIIEELLKDEDDDLIYHACYLLELAYFHPTLIQ